MLSLIVSSLVAAVVGFVAFVVLYFVVRVAFDLVDAFYTWRANYAFKRITRTDYTGWTGREP
jgi:hypothetical protein